MALVGALLVTLSTAMASAVDNFYWFFIFFSVLGGVGSGLILVQGNVSVQQYFRTKRATANGVFMSGGAVGNMVMPIILRYILVNDMLYLLSFFQAFTNHVWVPNNHSHPCSLHVSHHFSSSHFQTNSRRDN